MRNQTTETSYVPLLLGGLACVAVIALYAIWIVQPHIRFDDFNFLTRSRTWSEAVANLWEPMNDHAMPLSRLAAALLMAIVPGQSHILLAAQLQGVIVLVLGMWLLHVFMRRELDHALYALVAMIGFGVTTTFYEAVTSYSASFFIFALDAVLVALLAAQSWVRSRRWRHLIWCAIWCAVAPAWHGVGLLAGLYCAVYLLASSSTGNPALRRRWHTQVTAAAVPVVGTALFLAISLPLTASRIVRAEHYRGKTVVEAFDVRLGVQNTLRTIADNQVIGALGIDKKSAFSWSTVLVIDAVLMAGAFFWWRAAPQRRLLLLGLVLIVANDLLVYSARADWGYERTVHRWTRYHVVPHLGLVLFVVGGLPQFAGRWFHLRVNGRLSRRQVFAVVLTMAIALAVHLHRSRLRHVYIPEQHEMLRRVEQVDARARAHGISGSTAREAMGFVQFPLSYEGENLWEFLRGSPAPVPMTVEDARLLLSR